ncbi:TMV resistance protein N-like [Arachis ipaensis]|uniref:TMV resistance protein N-like n=1 Tax=Arachis ipaensis TaxID=130454 RepID=UPI000A2B2E2A|nr:TMV resistance protein N-like [Arachis ipaensis]XP_025672846.1 TMV resistance protein N [Arachis hypogaea]
MQRVMAANLLQRRFFTRQRQIYEMTNMAAATITTTRKRVTEPCDVFLNHRCRDTKKTVASLLYDHLRRNGFNPFLDNKNMKPGDKLFDKINRGVLECKIGVAVFSPRYCESYFCLHELALLMECRKKVIPIFCDVKPSQLRVLNNGKWSHEDFRRFRWALDEAKHIVGLTYNSSKGNLSEIVNSATEIIIGSMIELENEEHVQMHHHQNMPIIAL